MKQLFLFIFLFLSVISFSQRKNKDVEEDLNRKLFLVGDFYFSGGQRPARPFDNNKEEFIQDFAMNLSMGMGARYNIIELGDDFSIGLGINAAADLGLTYVTKIDINQSSSLINDEPEFGFLGIRAPATLTLNYGAGSTYDSIKDRGFSLGGGLEYMYAPIIGSNLLNTSRTITSPFVQVSSKGYTPDESTVLEFYVRFNFVGNDTTLLNPSNEKLSTPYLLSLGYSGIINF